MGKALESFELGFRSNVAQLRANRYSKAEHPYSFLSSERALDDLPEEEEMQEQDSKENSDPQDP